MVNVQKLAIEDINEVYRYMQESLATDFPEYMHSQKVLRFIQQDYGLKVLKKRLKKKDIIFLVARDGEKIVGYIWAGKPYGGVSFADWIAVGKEFRNKGVGSTLINSWQSEAGKRGAHQLHLMSQEHNLEFYKKRGFSVSGKIPEGYFGNESYLLYKTFRRPEEKNYLSEVK